MKKLLALLIACLALTVAACGDDDDDEGGSSGGGTATEQTDTGAAPAEEAGGSAEVDIPEIAFEPKDLTVKAGTTVTWTNSDDLPHTVTKTGGPGDQFDSGTLEPGGTFDLTLDVKGKVDYVCTIHPGQEGTVTVK
jgi:plastocyanin